MQTEFPSLETERLLLTAFRPDDEQSIFMLFSSDTVPGNDASELLLHKLGFKQEGLRRECGYWKGKFHDLKCFALLVS